MMFAKGDDVPGAGRWSKNARYRRCWHILSSMKRRQFVQGLAAASVGTAALAAPPDDWPNGFAKTLRDSFAAHWLDTKQYTLAVLDAMPPDGFDTRPNPAQRTFGEQLIHLARANTAYFRGFDVVAVPELLDASQEEPDRLVSASDKDAVRRYVAASFDYGTAALDALTQILLTGDVTLFGRQPHTGTDVFLRAYMHTAHHRGQIVVYLRVRGITPPAWQFEPTVG